MDRLSKIMGSMMTIFVITGIINPIILPNRAMLSMLAIADDIEKNTSGITTIKSKLINTSPNGLIIVAFSPKIGPIIAPIIIEIIKIIGNRYAFNLFTIKFSHLVILFLIAYFHIKFSSFKIVVY